MLDCAFSMPRRRPWRRPVVREERLPPTPETAVKLVPDPLVGLEPGLQQAAAALAYGWRTLTAVVRAKPAAIERSAPGKAYWTPAQSAAVERYKRWCGEMRRRHLDSRAVVAVCADSVPPWLVDRDRGWPPGRAAETLLEGLRVYAER